MSRRCIPLALLCCASLLAMPRTQAGVWAADSHAEQPYPIAPSLPANIRDFLSTEVSGPVFNVEHHYGRIAPASNGAYLDNVKASRHRWFIEDQRYGGVDLIGGILHRDRSLLNTGIRMFDFGLDREARDGSFPGSLGLFHGPAMFLADAGPAFILLKNWRAAKSFLGPRGLRHLNWEIGRLHDASRHLVHAWYHRSGHIDDGSKEDRFFEAAIALGSVGYLVGDHSLVQKSEVYAREGMRMTRSNGVMPENHGHDSSYQALGLVYATRYLQLMTGQKLFAPLRRDVALGERWLLSRVRRDGSVDRAGDDRTGPGCPEHTNAGACKSVNYQAVASALVRWGVIDKSRTYERRAYLVWLQNWRRQPGDALPKPSLVINPTHRTSKQVGYGWPVWVSGTRYLPLEPIRVYFNHRLVGKTVTDQIGSFGGHSPVSPVSFTPPTQRPGVYTITAKGTYGVVRRTKFTITS